MVSIGPSTNFEPASTKASRPREFSPGRPFAMCLPENSYHRGRACGWGQTIRLVRTGTLRERGIMSPVAIIGAFARRMPAVLATVVLLTAFGGGSRSLAQEPPAAAPVLPQEEVDQLVAPIALYPDNLLGQVLTAATYPLEVVMAARWSSANQRVQGQALEDAMQQQPWDPSVKGLTAVPQVLAM